MLAYFLQKSLPSFHYIHYFFQGFNCPYGLLLSSRSFIQFWFFFVCVVGISQMFSLVTNDWLEISFCYLWSTLIDIMVTFCLLTPICNKLLEFVLDLKEIHISTIYSHPQITKKKCIRFEYVKKRRRVYLYFFFGKLCSQVQHWEHFSLINRNMNITQSDMFWKCRSLLELVITRPLKWGFRNICKM